MTTPNRIESFFDRLTKFAVWLSSQIYFLRFPLLTALTLMALPYLGLYTDLRSLLASLFVTDKAGVLLVSIVAFTTAWAILVTWRLIALYGDERFRRENVAANPLPEALAGSPRFNITLLQALLASVTALPVTIAVVRKTVNESEIGLVAALLFALLGFLGSLALFFAAAAIQLLVNAETRARGLAKELFIVRWLPQSVIDAVAVADPAQRPRRGLRKFFRRRLGEGFFDETEGRFLSGHGLAASLLILSLLVFISAGRFSPHRMPALFFVVLFLMLLCWGLSGVSFLVDRYRIPVLVAILLVTYASSPNYYYSVQTGRTLKALPPKEVIGTGGMDQRKIIVVAAAGGGIQAAAWTARVLTGLQSMYPEFGQAVRVISSVSGGSSGAFFFVNGYNPETKAPDKEALDLILQMAAENSLDPVARGLVYHDFFHTVIPLWELGEDRGTALEKSWVRNCEKICDKFYPQPGKTCPIKCEMSDTLAGWAEDVKAGKRPANIFNATVVENGDRLLVSNTDINKTTGTGRVNIEKLLGGKDIQALTAARISAAFPYVSPAARAMIDQPAGARRHVVDGGYYDNYGMSSLVEWLNEAFTDKHLDKVLVIQIQNFADSPEKEPQSSYMSQLLAPIYTLLNIRTSAQASHKETEFELLYSKRPESIQTALFKFTCYDAPLTWKLTDAEKKHIRDCWDEEYVNSNDPDSPVKRVKQFLDEMKRPSGVSH